MKQVTEIAVHMPQACRTGSGVMDLAAASGAKDRTEPEETLAGGPGCG